MTSERRIAMLYRCIVCKSTWGKGDPSEGYSDGLCEEHQMVLLVKLYRERQLKEGNFDCAGRSNGFCDQSDCKCRSICLHPQRPPEPVINEAIAYLTAKAEQEMARKQAELRELFAYEGDVHRLH